MATPDYDDPATEEAWCGQQRAAVADYLRSQGVKHGRIGDWPAWHVAPVVSVWAIESLVRPEWIGWWVICGDLPTDYISAAEVEYPQHPRKAVRVIAERWLAQAQAWSEGRESRGLESRGATRTGSWHRCWRAEPNCWANGRGMMASGRSNRCKAGKAGASAAPGECAWSRTSKERE